MLREPRPDDRPDEELIREYLRDPQAGPGREAASALVDRWSGRVYRWAFRVLRNREDALDLAQDSLVQMIEALPRYEARGRFSAWLFVVVHNRCMSAVRRRSLIVDPEIDTDNLVSRGMDPADEHESAEARDRVFAAMECVLEPQERAALWLRAYEGMSVEEITRVLKLDGATGARGLLQTARRKLKTALRDTEEVEGGRP